MASPRSTQNRTTHFDLDTLQRPADQAEVEPFSAHLGDRTIVFKDPRDLSWQELLDIERIIELLNYVLEKEDRDYLLTLPIEGWKFNALLESFMKHYNFQLPDPSGKRRDRF